MRDHRIELRLRQERPPARRHDHLSDGYEAAILGALFAADDALVPRAELLAALYAGQEPPKDATGVLKVRIMHLRRKLRAAGVPLEIANKCGEG